MNSFWLAGMPGYQVIQLLDDGHRLPRPEKCPAPLYEMMMQCWSAEPDERPTFEALSQQLEDYFRQPYSFAKDQAMGHEPSGCS